MKKHKQNNQHLMELYEYIDSQFWSYEIIDKVFYLVEYSSSWSYIRDSIKYHEET